VILDEINVVVDFGLLEIDDVIEVVKARAPSVDVVLTGRYAPEQFMEIADLVSEVREVKHHYNKGISAREGIEF
jgi:cob(I)alamin adenosyltransferase